MLDTMLPQYLSVATSAAQKAGQIIRNAFSRPKQVEHKGTVDLVTDTDRQCEQLIATTIKEAFPDHLLIGEEGSSLLGYTPTLTDEPTWMVDPVDGTTNFVHSYPFVCVSIALAIRKEVVVGVVYNPILDELYQATRGGGAYLNGKSIHVSTTTHLNKALLATEIGTSRDEETVRAMFARIQTLTSQMRSVRCCGSCALNLCGVALGRLDAFFEIGFGGCWDVAAGSLILQEAGGKVLDPSGVPFDLMARRVLGTNGLLADQVVEVLASCPISSREPPPPLSTVSL